jgi:transcriptional regulator with XRE-family HTH domain
MSLGEQITHYRKLRGWTQTDLAEKLDVKPSHISRWENDKVRPHSDTLQAIARALGVSIDELTSGSQPATADATSMQVLGAIEKLDEEDKRLVKRIVDALLTKKRVQAALEAG